MTIASKPAQGVVVGRVQGDSVYLTEAFQVFLDELEQRLNANVLGDSVLVPSYTVAAAPDASVWSGGTIFVSNESGGAVLAFSDGTNWRRVTDRAVIS